MYAILFHLFFIIKNSIGAVTQELTHKVHLQPTNV